MLFVLWVWMKEIVEVILLGVECGWMVLGYGLEGIGCSCLWMLGYRGNVVKCLAEVLYWE